MKRGNSMKTGIQVLFALTCLFAIVGFTTVNAESSGDYRSHTTGIWNATATWERYDGSSWIYPAPSTPTSSDGVITIQNGHTVTVSAIVTVDQVVIDAGGQVNLNNSVTLTVADGLGTDFSVSGIFRNNGGTLTINAGATMAFNSGGKYQHGRNGGSIPIATWNANSTCEVLSVTSSMPTQTSFAQTFGHFIWNCASQGTASLTFGGNLSHVAGNFTVVRYWYIRCFTLWDQYRKC